MNAPAALRRGNRSARQWLVAIMLLCVLAAHALGSMHGIVHAFHAGTAQSAQSEQPSFALKHDPGAGLALAPDGLEALFSSHGSDGDCRLFDALGQQHGPALCAPALSQAQAPCIHLLRHLAGACVARWAAFFDARGPPASH